MSALGGEADIGVAHAEVRKWVESRCDRTTTRPDGSDFGNDGNGASSAFFSGVSPNSRWHEFVEPTQGDWVVQSPSRKYSASTAAQITLISAAVSSHMRGGSRSSRTRGGMRWTRQRWACDGIAGRVAPRERLSGTQDERRLLRTAKSCGPGPRCWCQDGGAFASPTGFDERLIRRRR
jgi:hypothetical protein